MTDARIVPTTAPVGAVVENVDLSAELDDPTFAQIETAYANHAVLVFRDQLLTPERLIAFTQRFGDIERYARHHYAHPDHPELLLISNIVEDGRNIGLADAGATWHTDMSYVKIPPRGSILYAREIPYLQGQPLGDTLFASTAAAYDDLSPATKDLLENRRTTHSYEGKHARRAALGKSNRKPLSAAEREALPPTDHPVIRTHAQTGRKCIYVVDGECDGITGLPDAEATSILADLAARCTRPDYTYRHRWRVNDVVMWDNCLVQHLAIQDYALPERRLLWRTTITGTVPS